MNEDNFKNTDLNELIRGVSFTGNVRSGILLGPNQGKVPQAVTELGNSTLQDNPLSFWVSLDSSKAATPYDWCSQFARNLRTSKGVPLAELAKFALHTGKSLSPFRTKAKQGDISEDRMKVPKELVTHFEQLIQSAGINESPHLVLALNDLNNYSDDMLTWLSESFNQVIRKSKAFKSCRFIFTSEEVTDRIKAFFDSFGFEKIHLVKFAPVEEKEISEKEIIPDIENSAPNSEAVNTVQSEDEIQKSLKKSALPCRLVGLGDNNSMDVKDAKKLLSPFGEIEQDHLFVASYPTRISRYSLEHFVSSRDAALSYNWLKRHRNLYNSHETGDLLLKDDLRRAARTIHSEANQDQSTQWHTTASILDTFLERFPDFEKHWIPINLQLFESFNSKILKQIFEGDQLEDVLTFFDLHLDRFAKKERRLSLSDDDKLVIRRYLEISGKSVMPRIENDIRDLWLKDQDSYNLQKSKMLEEKSNINTDIEDALNQVSQLKNLKETLLENFKNPKRLRPEKVYSFSTSRALLFIGLGTVAASLLSENIGPYHAACGLAFTLFGFFWPNVELKPSLAGTDGPNSNLAIETQQRSLNHRITSLCNRVEVMKKNLDDVELHLEKLGETPPLPYLESTDVEVSKA